MEKEAWLSGKNKPVASTEKGQNESLVGLFNSILQNRHQFWPCESLWPPPVSHTAEGPCVPNYYASDISAGFQYNKNTDCGFSKKVCLFNFSYLYI